MIPKPARLHNPGLLPIRWRRLGGRVLVTNDAGQYLWLDEAIFLQALEGSLPADHPAIAAMASRGLTGGQASEAALVGKLRRRSDHLLQGPNLHIVILTLRCNQHCVYCHANRKALSARQYDMSLDTAARVLQTIFQSPAPELTIEFQGGEPTLNFEALRYFVREASGLADAQGRKIYFSLVSNLSTLDAEQIEFLVDHGVMVCSSLDGPAELHDRNRPFGKISAHAQALEKMSSFAEAYQRRSLDPELAFVNALATVSRSALAQPEAIVDEYVRLGHKVVHLRPLNPFGMGRAVWAQEGYTAEEFLTFWRQAVDYIIGLNQQGVEIMEKMASLMLTRILTDDNPNYMDLRSPCGAGLGQLAYNYDGRVYTCDEGRMVGAMGDELFCIGDVARDSYEEIINHPGVRSLCVASTIECLPGCSDCAYVPFCGVCPVYNYVIEGDLVARCPANDRCRMQMGMLDHLFTRLEEPGLAELLGKWTETRDRSAVYQRFMQLDNP